MGHLSLLQPLRSASASAAPNGVVELLNETCEKKVQSVENTLEAKLNEWQLATQHKLSTQLMAKLDDKLQEQSAATETRFNYPSRCDASQ